MKAILTHFTPLDGFLAILILALLLAPQRSF